MVGFVPKEMFFTKGVGKHREKLTSFELALRSAGIAACNLVRVSSIFPPKCRILSRGEGMKRLEPGQVTFVVMSEAETVSAGTREKHAFHGDDQGHQGLRGGYAPQSSTDGRDGKAD